MEQFLMYLLLIVGFVLLIKGADYFVDGASSIAKKLHVSPLVIGLTIVALGTSAPEAAVSIMASLKGSMDMAVSNIVGSNIFNLLVVIGASSIMLPMTVHKSVIKKDYPFCIFITAVFFVLIADIWLFHSGVNEITRIDGIILLILFVAFMTYVIVGAVKYKVADDVHAGIKDMPTWQSLLYTVIGLIGVLWGGDMVVTNSQKIALALGMSETLVGLTIVSVATSLPELVTSVVAAKKHQSDIALGNVIGSCVFNILFVLGISATITPIIVESKAVIDTAILLAVTIITYIFSLTKKTIGRSEGAIILALYVAYLAYIIIRN